MEKFGILGGTGRPSKVECRAGKGRPLEPLRAESDPASLPGICLVSFNPTAAFSKWMARHTDSIASPAGIACA